MSDKELAWLEPFVTERSGRRPRDHRLILDGVFLIGRTPVAWRDLHQHFGKWSSFYYQFRRWTLSGLWELQREAFNVSGSGNPSLQMIGSTIIPAHHCSGCGPANLLTHPSFQSHSASSVAQQHTTQKSRELLL